MTVDSSKLVHKVASGPKCEVPDVVKTEERDSEMSSLGCGKAQFISIFE